MMAPVGMAMLFRAFPPEERVRASAILTVPTTFAPALGPVIGGLLVTDASWRWVFYVNVPIGAAAMCFGALFLEQARREQAGPFDLPGFLLSGIGAGLAHVRRVRRPGPRLGLGRRAWPRSSPACSSSRPWWPSRCARAEPIVALRLLRNRLFRCGNVVMVLVSMSRSSAPCSASRSTTRTAGA